MSDHRGGRGNRGQPRGLPNRGREVGGAGVPYQQGGNHGERGRGFRSGGGGGGRGRDSEIKWVTLKLKCEEAPTRKVPPGWKHEEIDLTLLPTAEEVKELMPVFRPGSAFQKKVTIETNHFEVQLNPPQGLCRYEVEITKLKRPPPPVDQGPVAGPSSKSQGQGRQGPPREMKVPRDIAKKVMILLVRRLYGAWGNKNPKQPIGIIHDFSRILFTTASLEPSVPLIGLIKHAELPGEDEEDCAYGIKITRAQINMDFDLARRLQRLTFESSRNDFNEPEFKQLYNILMKNLASFPNFGDERYVTVGRSNLMKRAEPSQENYLGWGMMNWRGVSAICTLGATWKPFINIEIQNTAYLIGQPVLTTISQILGRREGPDMERATNVTDWKPDELKTVEDTLKSCKVRRKVNGIWRDQTVTGICSKPAKDLYFTRGSTTVSVYDYFTRDLRLPIQHPDAPVLELGTKKAQVPAEFLTIKDGQSINRMLTGQPQKEMLKICKKVPADKHANIHEQMDELKVRSNPLLKMFGVTFPHPNKLEMNQMTATRVLQAPDLQYGKRSNDESGSERGRLTPSNGTWQMWNSNVQFYQPAQVKAWAILTIGHVYASGRSVNVLERMLIDVGKSLGMIFPAPLEKSSIQFNRFDNHDRIVKKLTSEFTRIKGAFGQERNTFILCIFGDNPKNLYSQVKQAAEGDGHAGVLTQCIRDQNVENRGEPVRDDVVRNILLKVNAKLGGIDHVPIMDERLFSKINILEYPTLILGMDVTHAVPSFACVTGSINRTGMPYMMHIQAQAKDNPQDFGAAEVIKDLDQIVNKMIKKFEKETSYFPGRIIVYRDGVGEGQFPEILQKEMMAIRKACTAVKADYKPPITFLAVQKRHKARLILKQGNKIPGGTDGNVPPGTVVDTDIVSNSDFYLQSHLGQLGTSRPTHYHVLWDDSDFSMDDIQGLTYHLCYAYSRCNRSISYPAPTYYAHWGALRAKLLCTKPEFQNWNGDQEILDRMNRSLQREDSFHRNFPMHFI